MTDVEGIGEAVTGGLVACAVEPGAGEAQAAEGRCLNCGAALGGDYCHLCGQKGHVHRSLRAFWHDLLHGVLHFEGKIWRTLPLLAWRPGELTRRYVEGERARFVSPLALFLFSVFLMFALFSTLGSRAYSDDGVTETPAEAERALRESREEGLAAVEVRRKAAETKDGQDVVTGSDIELGDLPAELGWFEDAYGKAKANPSLLIYKLQSNAYKFSWALIPLSVPFVWLLFLHRRRYRQYRMYDHAVFVTYSIAFMSLAVIAFTLLKLAGLNGTAALLPFLVPPIHMYRQLRGAYALSWGSALWRTILLIAFAFIAVGMFFLLLLTVGVLG